MNATDNWDNSLWVDEVKLRLWLVAMGSIEWYWPYLDFNREQP